MIEAREIDRGDLGRGTRTMATILSEALLRWLHVTRWRQDGLGKKGRRGGTVRGMDECSGAELLAVTRLYLGVSRLR